MPITFTPDASIPGQIQSAGSLLALVGTFTFSGSYSTGGDTLDLGALFKKIGLGKVYDISSGRGYTFEYDPTNKKVKAYSSANTELTAAAYNAALTASPVPVVIHGR